MIIWLQIQYSKPLWQNLQPDFIILCAFYLLISIENKKRSWATTASNFFPLRAFDNSELLSCKSSALAFVILRFSGKLQYGSMPKGTAFRLFITSRKYP